MTRISAQWLRDDASQKVCRLLTDAGHQVWFVGGCVRNELLGEPVSDLDLSTDAVPQRVMQLAKSKGLHAIPTGIDHGTVTLVVDDVPFEITTFRRDVATDGRRASVAYSDNITDDACRRDFTMNALYAAPDGEVADPLGGLPDLYAKRIRFIQDADRRIKEDYLRILRFFRFYAWYGDVSEGPDAEGLAACAQNIEGLHTLSVERVTAEMLKLLAAPDPAPALAAMAATGALAQVLPGADDGSLAILVHLEGSLGVAADPLRRLAAIGGTPSEALRLSKAQAGDLANITSGLSAIEAGYRHGARVGRDVLLVQSASLGQPVDGAALAPIKDASQQAFPLKAADFMPALSGPALGAALKEAEARWISSGFTLTKADLLD